MIYAHLRKIIEAMAVSIQVLPTLLNPTFLPAAPNVCAAWWMTDTTSTTTPMNFFAADVVAWVLQGGTVPVPVICDSAGVSRSADFQKADTTMRFIGTARECNDWVVEVWRSKGKTGTPVVSAR